MCEQLGHSKILKVKIYRLGENLKLFPSLDCEVCQYYEDVPMGEVWLNTVGGKKAIMKRMYSLYWLGYFRLQVIKRPD